MKQIKIVPILVVLCLLLVAAVAVSLISGISGGYNPDRYITLGQYQNLSVTVDTAQATDGEINGAMQQVLAELGEEVTATDGIVAADKVTVDYTGSVNGRQEDIFSGEEVTLTVGADEFFITGMDTHLVGAKAGDTLSVSLLVPENSHLMDYVGQTVDFQVKIRKVVRKIIPQLTDAVAKELGDYNTAEEFRTAFREQYLLQQQQENQATIRSQLWQTVVDNTQVEGYPSEELAALKEDFRTDLEAEAAEYEADFYDYVSLFYGAHDEEGLLSLSDEYCKNILKHQMVLKSLCKKERVSLSDEDYQQYMANYLELYSAEGYTKEDLVAIFGGEEALREQFLMEKVTDIIEETATVTEE